MDWTSIRGDLQNSGSRATSGPESDPELVWRHDAGARVFGTPLIAEDQVIVGTCAQAHDSRGCLVAIDRATGDRRWTSVSDGEEVRGTPVIAGDTAWLYDLGGRVFAVDIDKGSVRNSVDRTGMTPPDGVSPHVYKGTICASRHYLEVRDATTLHVTWETAEEYAYDVPAAFLDDQMIVGASKFTDESVFVGTDDFGARNRVFLATSYLQSIDPATGERGWKQEIGGLPRTPAISGDSIIVPTDASEPAGKLIGSITANVDEQPTLDEEPSSFSTFGTVEAIDVHSGTKRWTTRLDDPVRTMPAVTDEEVCVGTNGGDLIALENPEGSERWRYTVNDEEAVLSSPTIAGDTVYVGSCDDHLIAISVTDGTKQWRFETEAAVDSNPSVVEGTLYLADNQGIVYALR